MNDLIVLAEKNVRAKLKGNPFTLLERSNCCQVYSHPGSESLCVYGLISVRRFYIAKYTNTLKERLYRSWKQYVVLIKGGQHFPRTHSRVFIHSKISKEK